MCHRSVVRRMRRPVSGRLVVELHRTHILFDVEGLLPLAPNVVAFGQVEEKQEGRAQSVAPDDGPFDDGR